MKKTGCSNYLAAVDKNGLEGNEIYLDFKCNKFTCHKFKYIKRLEVGIPLSNIEFFARKKKKVIHCKFIPYWSYNWVNQQLFKIGRNDFQNFQKISTEREIKNNCRHVTGYFRS